MENGKWKMGLGLGLLLPPKGRTTNPPRLTLLDYDQR